MDKGRLKELANKTANILGYNMGETAPEMLHAINLREMYCQGYLQAEIDNPSPVISDKELIEFGQFIRKVFANFETARSYRALDTQTLLTLYRKQLKG